MAVCVDNFIAPVVEVIRISPTTLYARWSDVNAPVEQWVVTIQKDRMSAQNASKEIRFETKVNTSLHFYVQAAYAGLFCFFFLLIY